MITYADKLLSEEWKIKREEILIRDKNECQKCKNAKLIEGANYGELMDGKRTEKGVSGIIHSWIDNKPYRFFSVRGKFTGNLIFFNVLKNNKANIIGIRTLAISDYEKQFPNIKFRDSNGNIIQKGLFNSAFKWTTVFGLHIHHKYYKRSLEPWEYPDDALVTYCWICHEEEHQNEKIEVLDIHDNVIGHYTPCFRCFGAGYFPEYKHVEQGICFRCKGAKFEELIKNEF